MSAVATVEREAEAARADPRPSMTGGRAWRA